MTLKDLFSKKHKKRPHCGLLYFGGFLRSLQYQPIELLEG